MAAFNSVDTECNGSDPDWHYDLELAPTWLDQQGIALETFLLPGDIILAEASGHNESFISAEGVSRSSGRAQYGPPLLHIELDGWPRTDPDRGHPSQPIDWIYQNECINKDGVKAFWPYDPRNPKPGNPLLQTGQYVRMVGSLVTDEPHMMSDQPATNYVLRFGYKAAVFALGKERADNGQINAIKWMWGGNLTHSDESHPARWNEMHSPDYIEVLTPQDRTETVRCITVVAQNGLFAGNTEEITAEIRPPVPRPSQNHVLRYTEIIGPYTIRSTMKAYTVTPLADRIRVHVRVQGQGGMGANGKFFGIYRVGCQEQIEDPRCAQIRGSINSKRKQIHEKQQQDRLDPKKLD